MEPWARKAMGRPHGKYVDFRKTLTQPVKSSLARDTLLISHLRAATIGNLTWEDSRHIPIIDSAYNTPSDIEDPESDIESAPGRSFSSTPPPSSSPSPSLCITDHPASSTESFSERVSNTPYTSQTRMFLFREREGFMNWNPLIASLKQGVPGDVRYQNDRYQLVDYGGSSSVWGAAFSITGDCSVDALAIKLFRADTQEDSGEIPTELQIMKGLKHNHIVAFVGHFQRLNHFGVILYPLAICNLGQLLKGVSRTETVLTTGLYQILLTATGCLSSAVMYLHTSRIVKHKDIKPENILVDKFGSVHLADFGISKQYEDETVTGGQTPFTERYAPPEVVSQHDRDLSSDIFSLGCVFLEMVTVILGKSLRTMNEVIFERQPKGYYQSLYNVRGWIYVLKKTVHTSACLISPSHDYNDSTEDQHLSTKHLDIILSMMAECPKDRPAISEVYELFKDFTRNCLDCRHNYDQPRSDDIDFPAPWKSIDNSIKGERPANSYTALPAPLRDLSCPKNGRNIYTMPKSPSSQSYGENCAMSASLIIPDLMRDAYGKRAQRDLEEISSQMKRAVEQVIREFSPFIRSFGKEQDMTTPRGVGSSTTTSRLPNNTHNQRYQYQMLDELKLRITEVVSWVLIKYPNHCQNQPSSLIQYCGPSHSATYDRHRGSSSQGQSAKRGRTGHGNRVLRDRDDHDSELEDDPADGNGGNGHGTQVGSSEQPVSFACPFYRRDPERFASKASCAFTSYEEIYRLKIFRCPRCQESYNTEEGVEVHLQQDEICNRQDPIVFDEMYDWGQGYGQRQAEDLKARWRNISDGEKWKNIYKILFPYDNNTPCPYATQSTSSYLPSEADIASEPPTSLNNLPSPVFMAIWDAFNEGVNAGVNAGVDSSVDTSNLPINQPQTGLHGYYPMQPEQPVGSLQLYGSVPGSNVDDVAQAGYSMYMHEPPYLPNSYPLEFQPRSLVEPSNLTGDSTYYTNFPVPDSSSQQGTEFNPPEGLIANSDELGCPSFGPLASSWDMTGSGYSRGEEYSDNNTVFDHSQSHGG